MAAILADYGEAGDIGGAVADVDHVPEGDGAHGFWHVIVDVLVHGEEAFVDPEEVLSFLGVRDDAFGKADPAGFVFGELASEDGFHKGGDATAFDEDFEAAGDDVVLELDAEGFVMGFEDSRLELVEHVGQSWVEAEATAEFSETRIGWAVDAEAVEQQLHVGELVVESGVFDQFVGFSPEGAGVDPEGGEEDLFLHVVGAEGEVVVVDNRDGVLRRGHEVPPILPLNEERNKGGRAGSRLRIWECGRILRSLRRVVRSLCFDVFRELVLEGLEACDELGGAFHDRFGEAFVVGGVSFA